jgi:hypothetical protein
MIGRPERLCLLAAGLLWLSGLATVTPVHAQVHVPWIARLQRDSFPRTVRSIELDYTSKCDSFPCLIDGSHSVLWRHEWRISFRDSSPNALFIDSSVVTGFIVRGLACTDKNGKQFDCVMKLHTSKEDSEHCTSDYFNEQLCRSPGLQTCWFSIYVPGTNDNITGFAVDCPDEGKIIFN